MHGVFHIRIYDFQILNVPRTLFSWKLRRYIFIRSVVHFLKWFVFPCVLAMSDSVTLGTDTPRVSFVAIRAPVALDRCNVLWGALRDAPFFKITILTSGILDVVSCFGNNVIFLFRFFFFGYCRSCEFANARRETSAGRQSLEPAMKNICVTLWFFSE